MKTCNPKYADQIPDLIRRATGQRTARLIPIPTVPDTIVYEVELPAGAVIFKAIDPDGRDPDGIGLEAWMCERVRALGVPAPRVLTVDTSRSILPTSYFIMEKARGQPLSTVPAAQQPAFLRQIGAYVRQIHTVHVEQFGRLDEQRYRQHGAIRGSHSTWRAAVLKDIPPSLAYFRETGALEEPVVRAIERVLELADPMQSPFTGTPLEFYNSQFFRTLGEPAGGLLTTAAGALRLISAYQKQPRGFLQAETAAAATRNQVAGLGGGVPGWFTLSDCRWGLGPAPAPTFPWVPKKASAQSYGHTGASGCMVWYDPAVDRAWVVLGTRIPDTSCCDQLFPQLGAALLAADASDQHA